MRASGILLPVASLPSPYGIGSFSKCAYEFVDFLREAGQAYWQILPLGPTGYGDSPYQSFSSFAGNPYFIDLDDLAGAGLLEKAECRQYDADDKTRYIDYARVYQTRFLALKKAYARFLEKPDPAYAAFLEKHGEWLDDYCFFMALKDAFGGKSWQEWEPGIRMRDPRAFEAYRARLEEEIGFYRFLQFYFYKHWGALKAYANQRGVRIIGDIPIYVALDSADAWANPRLFQFDSEGRPLQVAGCPPDGFSASGQVWGNPLYDWSYHAQTGYAWWVRRIRHCQDLYDVLRIDHFRGFDAYFCIPYAQETAAGGHWEKGPGMKLFRTLRQSCPGARIIAEDLGFLTDSVEQLVKDSGYPGMKVLQFAFDSREQANYFPYTYTRNCVAYTGTHDNQTVVGWFRSLPPEDYRTVARYFGLKKGDGDDIHWRMIREVLASVADTAIIPLQDYLGLDDGARINTPSVLGNNWTWRMPPGCLTQELADAIRDRTEIYGRATFSVF